MCACPIYANKMYECLMNMKLSIQIFIHQNISSSSEIEQNYRLNNWTEKT